MRSAFEEEATDSILSFGQKGSKGKKASPHLNTERTAIIYSTEGGIYIPTIFGLYSSLELTLDSALGLTVFKDSDI
jgi:hypothetical protein